MAKRKFKRKSWLVTGMSASGEGYFKKTVYTKKQAAWYRVRGYRVRRKS